MKQIDQTATRYHGHHWWYGVSNERLANGSQVRLAGWHVVHCWTAHCEGYAIGAHFSAPMRQEMMKGGWGAELIPPSVPTAQTRVASRPNVVAGRRCDRSNAEIEQACSVLIEAEVEKGDFSDSALIGLLTDVVRLTREYSDVMNQTAYQPTKERDELLEHAWSIIANVSGGDWTRQDITWRDAARNWADKVHRNTDPDWHEKLQLRLKEKAQEREDFRASNMPDCEAMGVRYSSPTGTEAAVCSDIARRQQQGIKKYGQSVRENPLQLVQWLNHAYEETLDNAVYLKRAMEELQSKVNQAER